MTSFAGTNITLRRKDGALTNLTISPYPQILFDFCEKNKWDKAIKICRFVKEQLLWACLSAISLNQRDLATAEIALAAIEQPEKVKYITSTIEMPSETMKNASMLMFNHKYQEAEQLFMVNKLYYRAIKLNIKLYKWMRALEIAQQTKSHLDTVLAYRQRYLQQVNKEETEKYVYIKQVGAVDWNAIKQKIKAEKDKESKLK